MKICKNKYVIFVFFFLLVLVFASFYQYYNDYFSYYKDYYLIKDICYDKEDLSNKVCEVFKNDETMVEKYVDLYDPVEAYKKLDAITLTSEIVENNVFSNLQYFSPILIIVIIVGTFHKEFSSGMFKNYLLRLSYKNYLKRVLKFILKVSLITPLILFVIFIISCLITRFNFNIVDETRNLSVYNSWKYSNFLMYSIVICFLQYIMNIIYSCLALISCKSNKNRLVAIIFAYVLFLLLHICVYNILYSQFLSNIFKYDSLNEIFMITGYWFFNIGPISLFALLVALILLVLVVSITYLMYRDKEKVVISYEKQSA